MSCARGASSCAFTPAFFACSSRLASTIIVRCRSKVLLNARAPLAGRGGAPSVASFAVRIRAGASASAAAAATGCFVLEHTLGFRV